MPQADLLMDADLPSALMSAIESAPMPGIFDLPSDASELRSAIQSLTPPFAGRLVESALWLLAGELDRSHDISQNIGSAEGSFWHGIMHRREGDYSNAKYWFRQVGEHPVHSKLVDLISENVKQLPALNVSELTNPDNLAFRLVDLCQAAKEASPETVGDLTLICWWEWQLLLAECV